MRVLSQLICQEISGGEAMTVLSYAGLVGLAMAFVGIEVYLIQLAQDEYEAIDFSSLTPKEAYDLGVSHTFLYCRHF